MRAGTLNLRVLGSIPRRLSEEVEQGIRGGRAAAAVSVV